MHFAVLISMRKFEDAEKFCDQLSHKVDPNDCLMAMRLMNSLKARSVDDQFMLDFAALCLRKLGLSDNKEVAQSMQADLLRICGNFENVVFISTNSLISRHSPYGANSSQSL